MASHISLTRCMVSLILEMLVNILDKKAASKINSQDNLIKK